MIIYFADRQLNILGQASTNLPKGLVITKDNKIEDVETGVNCFECTIPFDQKTRSKVEKYTEVGNYLLRSHDNENELYTIIDAEIDTKKQTVYIYAEDDGMDLLNEVVGVYEADKAYPITHYINKYAAGAGFQIGINEVESLTRKLSWDGEATAAERLASVATQFDGCEVSYTFDIDGLYVVNKYVNIFKKRGKDAGATLRLNEHIDNIITVKSINNLATALQCTGGTINQNSTILEATSSGSPKVAYTVDLATAGRTANTVKINATIKAALTSQESVLDKEYGLKASLYMGGVWHSVTIKATDKDNEEKWSDTISHTTDFSFTVSGVPAGVTTYTDIKLKVERTDSKGGTAGILAATTCEKYIIPNYVTGGENGEEINSRPITIEGYKYDDGDFYVEGNVLKSRVALDRWRRCLWRTEESQKAGGHITKLYTYDTDSQETLCARAITELKKIRDMEVNYKVEITDLPDNVKIGDRVNIVDDAGELYLSTRLLQLETSVCEQQIKATLGEHLLKSSGISEKVAELAAQFAKAAQSAAHAAKIAVSTKNIATNANEIANAALMEASKVQEAADAANSAAHAAQQSADNAQVLVNEAQAAVEIVEKSVESLEETIAEAQRAAANAQNAAETAESKVEEATTAARNAIAEAESAKNAVASAQSAAETASAKADTAKSTAETAKSEAESAKATANAAKADAEQAAAVVESLGENLTTLSNTMQADYARKTDLTETEASLQTQINQNAAEISSTASRITTIDETANNAAQQAQNAQNTAQAAQNEADQAAVDAAKAQQAANNAATAAQNAQSEADAAKTAAANAKSVADQAEADLEKAKADLVTVASRVDVTEADIYAAQQVIINAQEAAQEAKSNAEEAATKAANAQSVANTAATNASNAQTVANEAASAAALAQQVADEAKGDASTAQAKANEAAGIAAEAQRTANTATTNAANAQTKANEAAATAAAAQSAADQADAKAAQAAADLAAAEQNLANVTSRVGATEEEVAAAQAAVNTAQAAADKAKQDAAAAQSTADTAKANAATAQTAANNAKSAADTAQAAADTAKKAADDAQKAVNALAVRVTTAETDIIQNSEQIALRATKTEVVETLGGYYTKTQADAEMQVKADSIISSVSETYATKDETGNRITSVESLINQLATSISMLVTDKNGESLMTQTENGWAFDISKISGTLDSATDDIDSLTERMGGVDNAVNALQQALSDVGVLTDYVKITTYNGQPCIELGESENGFKLRITNTDIQFADGSVIPAYISNKKLMIEQAEVKDELQFGGFVWKTHGSGNMGLVWKGTTATTQGVNS